MGLIVIALLALAVARTAQLTGDQRGRVLDDDPSRPAKALRSMVRRLGEPVVRPAVGQAMKLMGRSFVLGFSTPTVFRSSRINLF